jgi:hypothetical protein
MSTKIKMPIFLTKARAVEFKKIKKELMQSLADIDDLRVIQRESLEKKENCKTYLDDFSEESLIELSNDNFDVVDIGDTFAISISLNESVKNFFDFLYSSFDMSEIEKKLNNMRRLENE